MGTRCKIEVVELVDGEYGNSEVVVYSIYRHWDGYPQGVITDIKALIDLIYNGKIEHLDIERFLSDFIFYSRLGNMLKLIIFQNEKESINYLFKDDAGALVCSGDCYHFDLDYFYKIYVRSGKIIGISILEYDYEHYMFREIFNGSLEEAFNTFAEEGDYYISKNLLTKFKEFLIENFENIKALVSEASNN